ncbi:MAG: DUF3300 domain-containing protein [Gammaproteobacteria bacterium]|nr:DUF3300 domain-containing protein [Gammaproteobacteria bacterium]
MKAPISILLIVCLFTLLFSPISTWASDSKTDDNKSTFSQAELDQMMAPIALYPDSLLSQILMASTYPSNVAEAVTWSKNNPKQKGDEAVKAVQNKSWDPSVMSLVAFPQVLEMMGEQPDWVQNVGDAFLAAPDTVMNTVQTLRQKAKDEGNLKTTEEQKIVIEQASPEIIIIEPAKPSVVYVPVYNPTVVYGTWWWPAYTPYYYYPPRYGFGSAVVAGIGFGVGVAITNSLWGGCNWRRGDVDINVNRYNNINVNKNRINASNKTTNWNHNKNNRKGVPYRDKASQKKFNNDRSASKNRQDYRGRERGRDHGIDKTQNLNSRDSQRKRAQETLKQRGTDPAAARRQLSGASGDKVRNQVNKVDRSQAKNNFNSMDKSNLNQRKNNLSSKDRVNNSSPSNKRSNSSVGHKNRNSSLSGIQNQSRTSNNFNRGNRSRGSFGGGGHRGGGRRR